MYVFAGSIVIGGASTSASSPARHASAQPAGSGLAWSASSSATSWSTATSSFLSSPPTTLRMHDHDRRRRRRRSPTLRIDCDALLRFSAGLARLARRSRVLLLAWLACRRWAQAAECTGPETRPGAGGAAGSLDAPWLARPEVRRHLGRRSRSHPRRRRPRRPHAPRRATTSWSSSRRWARPPTTSCAWRTTSPTRPGGREMDMLLTAGERISMALLSHGRRGPRACPPCRSPGRRPGIVTDTEHGRAKIIEVRGDRIREALAAGKVAIVAGFQGVSTDARHHHARAAAAPTPPRSRSRPRSAPTCARSTPTSKASTPPTRASCPTARKLARVSFDEMLEMAATGGRVLALRSVEFARNHGVRDARAFELHLGAGHLGHRGGPVVDVDGAGDHLGRHARHLRGEGHDRAGARPARVSRRRVFRDARRRGRQRRHDRAERVDRGPHRHLVHRAARPTSPRAESCMEKIVVDTEASGLPHRRAASAGSRSSARA